MPGNRYGGSQGAGGTYNKTRLVACSTGSFRACCVLQVTPKTRPRQRKSLPRVIAASHCRHVPTGSVSCAGIMYPPFGMLLPPAQGGLGPAFGGAAESTASGGGGAGPAGTQYAPNVGAKLKGAANKPTKSPRGMEYETPANYGEGKPLPAGNIQHAAHDTKAAQSKRRCSN